MTINTIITSVDSLVPNVITPETKAGWIAKVDGMVNKEIVKSLTYTEPTGDVDLLVPTPYDDLYQLYVEAQIARYNQDYDAYNNTILAYKAAFDDYAAYHRRTNVPAEAKWASSAITVDTAADTFTILNNPLHNGERVIFRTTDELPAPLANGYEYFVINLSGNAFQVSRYEHGAAIDITSTGGTYTMEKAAARIRNLW